MSENNKKFVLSEEEARGIAYARVALDSVSVKGKDGLTALLTAINNLDVVLASIDAQDKEERVEVSPPDKKKEG